MGWHGGVNPPEVQSKPDFTTTQAGDTILTAKFILKKFLNLHQRKEDFMRRFVRKFI
jgi:hypothetical protein